VHHRAAFGGMHEAGQLGLGLGERNGLRHDTTCCNLTLILVNLQATDRASPRCACPQRQRLDAGGGVRAQGAAAACHENSAEQEDDDSSSLQSGRSAALPCHVRNAAPAGVSRLLRCNTSG
jgi:hypothetical protein